MKMQKTWTVLVLQMGKPNATTVLFAMVKIKIWTTAASVLAKIKIWTVVASALVAHQKMHAVSVMKIVKMIIVYALAVRISMQKILMKMQSLMIVAVSTLIILFMCPVNIQLSKVPFIMQVPAIRWKWDPVLIMKILISWEKLLPSDPSMKMVLL